MGSGLDVSRAAHRTDADATGESALAPSPPRAGREAAVVGAAAAAVYLLTLSAVPALTHDSLGYQLAIQAGGDALWHPHHLVYNALARGWLDVWQALGVDDPLVALESLNAVIGGCVVALIWLVLRDRARLPLGVCAAGTTGAAASYGLWFYSVSIEVYVLPLALLLATLLVLTTPVLSVRTMLGVGTVNGLAVITHQVNVLFALVVLAVVMRGADRSTALRRLAAYGASAAATVGVAYAAVLTFAIEPRSMREAGDWLTSYAQSGGYWHLRPTAPIHALAGAARALVGGHVAYRFEPVREWMHSTFTDRSLDDEEFLVRDLPIAGAVVLAVLAVGGAGLLAAVVVRGVQRRREIPEPAAAVLRALAVWVAVYTAFFVVWEPSNPEFWIPQVTAVWMLAAVLSTVPSRRGDSDTTPLPVRGTARRRWPVALTAAAIAVGTANLFGTIHPATDADNDVYAVRYRALGDVLQPADVIVVDRPHLGLGYAERYTDARARAVYDYRIRVSPEPPNDISPEELVDDLDHELGAGHTVAIDAVLVVRPTSRATRAGAALRERYADSWRVLDVAGAADWYLVEP